MDLVLYFYSFTLAIQFEYTSFLSKEKSEIRSFLCVLLYNEVTSGIAAVEIVPLLTV